MGITVLNEWMNVCDNNENAEKCGRNMWWYLHRKRLTLFTFSLFVSYVNLFITHVQLCFVDILLTMSKLNAIVVFFCLENWDIFMHETSRFKLLISSARNRSKGVNQVSVITLITCSSLCNLWIALQIPIRLIVIFFLNYIFVLHHFGKLFNKSFSLSLDYRERDWFIDFL